MLSGDFESGFTMGMRQVAEWLMASHERAAAIFDSYEDKSSEDFMAGLEFGQEWIIQAHKELADQIQNRLEEHAEANVAKAFAPPDEPTRRRGRRERGRHRL